MPEKVNSNTGAWDRSVNKIISVANFQGANLVGVTSIAKGAGVSTVSAAVARAYAEFGRSALLVDASSAALGAADAEGNSHNPVDLVASSVSYAGLCKRVELSMEHVSGLRTSDQAVDGMQRAAGAGMAVIVDLPPTGRAVIQRTSEMYALEKVCDIVFLICPTGGVTRLEIKECVELCQLNEIALGGIILNDWQLPGSKYLAEG